MYMYVLFVIFFKWSNENKVRAESTCCRVHCKAHYVSFMYHLMQLHSILLLL